jgi:hypothetical protein
MREEAVELEAQIGRMKRTMFEDSARASERFATMNASKEMCQGQIRQASASPFSVKYGGRFQSLFGLMSRDMCTAVLIG